MASDAVGIFHVKNAEVSKFMYVSHRDSKSRCLALEKIQDSVESWLDGYGSPPTFCTNFGNGSINGKDTRVAFLEEVIPDLLRLSISCPFEDVREKCSEILVDIKVSFKFIMILFQQIILNSSMLSNTLQNF